MLCAFLNSRIAVSEKCFVTQASLIDFVISNWQSYGKFRICYMQI